MASRAAREFESLYRTIREDIFAFCRAINFDPTWQQRDILAQVQAGNGTRNFMAIKSGQGPGKSTIAVVIALWRILQHEGALVVLTAPTQRQCRDAFLARAREILGNADPIFKRIFVVTATKIEVCGQKDWGVKTVTATKPENAQGYHQAHLTIIVDEASGVPREIITQFKGTISNPDTLFLMVGNPNLRDCSFFDCFNALRDRWWTYTINAEETARDYPDLLSPDRNEEIAEEFGIESDVYRIRVLGEFPFQDPDCVISSEDLLACTKTDLVALSQIPRDLGGARKYPAKQFGMDLARFGGDESVIYQRLGNSILDWWRGSHVDPNLVVDKAFAMQVGSGWRNEDTWWVPDAGGMGQGVMQNFYSAGRNNVLEFHNEGRPSDKQYANLITEAWFHVGYLAKRRLLHMPNDPILIQQLSSRRYTTNKDGQLILWTKDQYMKEGHDSPDRAEAFVMAMYDALLVSGQATGHREGRRIGARVDVKGSLNRVGTRVRR